MGVRNEQKALQSSDSIMSQDAKIAMKKSVVLEKERTRSHKKVDMKMVYDPKGISIRLTYEEMDY